MNDTRDKVTRVGLVGLHDLAAPLRRAGFEVVSDPDLRRVVLALNAASYEHGRFPVLLLNSPRVTSLIPRLARHLQLTVLGTEATPAVEGEGFATYQLPGSVRDIVKNTGLGVDSEAVPDHLEFDAGGRLVDLADWSDWAPDEEDGQLAAEAVEAVEGRAAAVDPEAADVFGSAAAFRASLRGDATRSGLGQVVIAVSASGGVGKSTACIALAGRAADRGKRVVLIDGSPGQGDIATYLRVGGANLPTMFDAVADGHNLTAGLIPPARLTEARNVRLKPLGFALLQAPSELEVRSGRITPAAMYELVEAARRIADLVVVDTQIVESDDPRGMLEGLILPQLGKGAWAVAVAGLSSAGTANLIRVLTDLEQQGVDSSHVLSMLSRIPPEVTFDHETLVRALREKSVHIGTAWNDNEVMMAMNRGETVSDFPVLAHLSDTVLHRILDMPVQAPVYDPHASRRRGPWPWSRQAKNETRK